VFAALKRAVASRIAPLLGLKLVMLAAIVSQIVGSVAIVTSNSMKRMGADDEVRTAFDRMAGDFDGMVTRPDVNPLWVSNSGNDEFYFYSQAPASFTNAINSQIAILGYRVSTNGLERLERGLDWDDILFTNGTVSSNMTATNVLAPSVFRMEYSLIMKPGKTNNNGSANGFGVYMKTNNAGQAMQDVAGIIVTLGVLDQTSRSVVSDGKLTDSDLLSQFPDASTNGIPMGSWTTNARLLPIAPAARAQIRVYQRSFPLNL
jgi:hypothetical protein